MDEQKHGRLIAEMLTNEYGYKRCSVCECGLTLFITDKNNILQEPNFCPNCGARFS